MFSPTRLRLARHRLGLTLTRLSAASGVSPRSLTAYETGAAEPSAPTLAKLAAALQVPEPFLAREPVDVVPVDTVSFRKLSKTSALHRDAVLASATLAVEFFGLVETRFALPSPDVPTLDKHSPEDAADLVRRRWGLGDRPVLNMVHLVEAKGVRLAALPRGHDAIDAFCFHRDGVPYVFVNTTRTAERRRFDIAHELGHLVLHGDLEMDPSTSKQREEDANAFAAAFLMPADGVLAQQLRDATVQQILTARTRWTVSAMAMTHRLKEVGSLSDWQYRSACLTLAEAGYRTAEPDGARPETSQLLRKVMFGSDRRVSVAEAAAVLQVRPDDVRAFLHDLVPVGV